MERRGVLLRGGAFCGEEGRFVGRIGLNNEFSIFTDIINKF